jgi:hypothetical protein
VVHAPHGKRGQLPLGNQDPNGSSGRTTGTKATLRWTPALRHGLLDRRCPARMPDWTPAAGVGSPTGNLPRIHQRRLGGTVQACPASVVLPVASATDRRLLQWGRSQVPRTYNQNQGYDRGKPSPTCWPRTSDETRTVRSPSRLGYDALARYSSSASSGTWAMPSTMT